MNESILDDNLDTSIKEHNLLSERAIKWLEKTGKWVLFLSILGFVYLGLITLLFLYGMIAGGTSIGFFSGPAFGFIFFTIFITIAIIPMVYLYNFSVNIKLAVNKRKTLYFDNAFDYLKRYFTYLGILTIVIISFYLLSILWVIGVGQLYF